MIKHIYIKLPLFFLDLFIRKLRKQLVKSGYGKVTQKPFLRAIGKDNQTNFLEYFMARNTLNFFIDGTEKEGVIKMIKEIYPQSIDQTIKGADKVCGHVFNLLGSGETDLKRLALIDGLRAKGNGYVPINWQQDFKSGNIWPLKYIEDIERINLKDESDIKVPWELSRFQHIPTLGKAYWYTGNELYTKEFMNQIEDWVDNNPVYYGVNWYWAMDASIRAVNWIWGCFFFKDSHLITNTFAITLFRSLFEHGKFIYRNLEFGHIRGNHYFSDIVGLIYLGILFRETKEGKKWLEKGLSALKEEMKFQVYPDGVDFEGSISYHRLVTELFLSATLLCIKNGITFPQWYMNRVEKMIEFVMYYTKPDGTAPQIGDNDDGRLHILANYGNWNRVNHRYLLSVGAVLFKRQDFKEAAGKFHEEAFLLLKEEGLRKFKMLPDCKFSLSSKAFSEGGFYIMRHDDLYMIIGCVPADPKAPSGHKHNSRLSFELFAYDKSFIVDPGAYIYTADKEMRNLFRSTRYHNTVMVDGEEQNRFDEDELFAMGLDATVKVNRWLVTEKYDFLDAEHNGYARLKNPVVHRRQIYFNKKKEYWVIKDMLTGEGGHKHKFDLYFHFAPMELKEKDELVIETDNKNRINIVIVPLETEGIKMKIENGWVSYSYGRKVEAPIVKYSKAAEVPTEFVTLIATGQVPSAEEIGMNMKSLREAIKEIDVE